LDSRVKYLWGDFEDSPQILNDIAQTAPQLSIKYTKRHVRESKAMWLLQVIDMTDH